MQTLDKIDKELLYELELDARQPFSKLSRKLGISKEVVKYRFDSLVRNGTIKGTTVFTNLPRLGYFYVKVYFRFTGLTAKEQARLFGFLEDSPEITWIVECFGRYDLIVNGVFRDLQHFESFREKFFSVFGKFVELDSTTFLSDLKRLPRPYLSSNPRLPASTKFKPYVAGEIDLKLFSLLSKDSRSTLQQLGAKIGLSGPAVKDRIEKLKVCGFIGRFTVNLDYSKFNYSFVKVMFSLKSASSDRKKAFLKYCEGLPGLFYIVTGTGVSDVDLDFEVENLKSFQNTLRQLKLEFPDLIREYELLIVSNERKLDLAGGLLKASKS